MLPQFRDQAIMGDGVEVRGYPRRNSLNYKAISINHPI